MSSTPRFRPTELVRIVCAALQQILLDRLREAKDVETRNKIRLRIKLQADYFLKDRIPDRATERRAGYGRRDPAPWHPAAAALKAGPSPLLYPTLQPKARKRPRRKP